MGVRAFVVLMVLLCSVSVASADLAAEEREFGEHGYKAMRAIHEQTCTCKDDGNCRLKVSRGELRAQLQRYTDSLKTMVPRLWPALTKKMAAMSTADARAYGERLGQQYLDTLPRADVLLWARMLSSCWGTSSEPSASSQRPNAEGSGRIDRDIPHDGSLSNSGEVHDLTAGKLDEASGISTFLQGCWDTGKGNPNAAPFCGCLADYLRLSPPSVIRMLQSASQTGDVSELLKLPGVSRCSDWTRGGAHGPHPFTRKGMKSSVEVEAAYTRCRTTMTKGKEEPGGIVFCNRLVATSR